MVMLMLLFPDKHGLVIHPAGFSLMSCLDGAGDREEVLLNKGRVQQRSGTGQNNYRTNLLEALVGSLEDRVSGLQLLWRHVDLCLVDLHSRLGDGIWYSDQDQLIATIVADSTNTLTFVKQLICQLSIVENLDMTSYYSPLKKLIAHLEGGGITSCYSDLKTIAHCSHKAARRLWPCIAMINSALARRLAR